MMAWAESEAPWKAAPPQLQRRRRQPHNTAVFSDSASHVSSRNDAYSPPSPSSQVKASMDHARPAPKRAFSVASDLGAAPKSKPAFLPLPTLHPSFLSIPSMPKQAYVAKSPSTMIAILGTAPKSCPSPQVALTFVGKGPAPLNLRTVAEGEAQLEIDLTHTSKSFAGQGAPRPQGSWKALAVPSRQEPEEAQAPRPPPLMSFEALLAQAHQFHAAQVALVQERQLGLRATLAALRGVTSEEPQSHEVARSKAAALAHRYLAPKRMPAPKHMLEASSEGNSLGGMPLKRRRVLGKRVGASLFAIGGVECGIEGASRGATCENEAVEGSRPKAAPFEKPGAMPDSVASTSSVPRSPPKWANRDAGTAVDSVTAEIVPPRKRRRRVTGKQPDMGGIRSSPIIAMACPVSSAGPATGVITLSKVESFGTAGREEAAQQIVDSPDNMIEVQRDSEANRDPNGAQDVTINVVQEASSEPLAHPALETPALATLGVKENELRSLDAAEVEENDDIVAKSDEYEVEKKEKKEEEQEDKVKVLKEDCEEIDEQADALGWHEDVLPSVTDAVAIIEAELEASNATQPEAALEGNAVEEPHKTIQDNSDADDAKATAVPALISLDPSADKVENKVEEGEQQQGEDVVAADVQVLDFKTSLDCNDFATAEDEHPPSALPPAMWLAADHMSVPEDSRSLEELFRAALEAHLFEISVMEGEAASLQSEIDLETFNARYAMELAEQQALAELAALEAAYRATELEALRTEKELAAATGPVVKKPLFKSTVDSWNRERDRNRVELELALPEEGNPDQEFVDPKQPDLIVAKGYNRVLYGDHGPYLEFKKDQVYWEAFPKVLRKCKQAYYDEHYTESGYVKAYEQRRTVRNKPNPPPGEWSVHNNRKNGYADYKINMVYMPADNLQLLGVEPNRSKLNAPPSDLGILSMDFSMDMDEADALGSLAHKASPDQSEDDQAEEGKDGQPCFRCPSGVLNWHRSNSNGIADVWLCANIATCNQQSSISGPFRWTCQECKIDICESCHFLNQQGKHTHSSIDSLSKLQDGTATEGGEEKKEGGTSGGEAISDDRPVRDEDGHLSPSEVVGLGEQPDWRRQTSGLPAVWPRLAAPKAFTPPAIIPNPYENIPAPLSPAGVDAEAAEIKPMEPITTNTPSPSDGVAPQVAAPPVAAPAAEPATTTSPVTAAGSPLGQEAAASSARQKLQIWAARVNSIGQGNEELTKRCREFVRTRILRAHTEGNLHSANWDEELVPSAAQLLT